MHFQFFSDLLFYKPSISQLILKINTRIVPSKSNKWIIEPNSKSKGAVIYTIWHVIDIKVTLKQMNNGRIDTRVNNPNALKTKAGFHTTGTISVSSEKKVQRSLQLYRNHSSVVVGK